MKRLRKINMFNFVLWLGIVLIVPLRLYSKEFDKNMLREKFDYLNQAINNGEGYSRSTNEEGELAWAESYLLVAYLDMYEATHDTVYIDIFISHAKRVMKNTDKSLGIVDHQGLARTGWGSTKYSRNKERMVHVVQTGVILYPLARFALMVKENPGLGTYSEFGKSLVELTVDAVAEFDGQWRAERTGEGSYWFRGNEPMRADLEAPMPFNGTLALGRVIILLHRLTDKDAYRNKARAMALLFKNNLLSSKKNGYIWGYRPNLSKYPKIEDLSHGATDVGFAIEAYNSGIVFTRQDMVKFANTLLSARYERRFSIYVDGHNDNQDPWVYSDASGRWLDLSEIDCSVYDPVYKYLTDRINTNKRIHPQVLLGISKLVKYHEKCRKD